MNDQDEDFKGKKIPKKYWNKLVEWRVSGPYDGCWYKYSQACVDAEGNFRLINSEGRDLNDWMEVHKSPHGLCIGYKGLYDHSPGWCDREKRRIGEKHGFRSVEGADVEFNRLYYAAVEKVFGKDWYRVDHDERESRKGEVEALVKDDRARLDAYKADMKDYRRRRQERLNALFCGALYDKTPDEWKLYPIDRKHIKHTCEDFCRNYQSTVGVMCGVLDRLQDIGYSCWCRCSDCGKMFQLEDVEKFSFLVDDNAYHGDNGIGCIYTRVQCESCHSDTECPACCNPNLPTQKELEGGHAYDHWTFRERFVGIWLGVCEYCADPFFYKDEYKHWDEDMDELEATVDSGKEQLEKYLAVMKENNGKTEEELKRLREKGLNYCYMQWIGMFNALRDKMQQDIEEHFSDLVDRAAERLANPEEMKNYV